MTTILQRFQETVACFPDHPFLHIPRQAAAPYSEVAIQLTYRQVSGAVAGLAEAYGRRGYGLGHRVGLALDNRAEFFAHFLALNGLGVCVVPINAAATHYELAYFIDRAELSAVVALEEHAPKLTEAAAVRERPPPVIEVTALDRLPAVTPAPEAAPGPGTPAAIVFTSGTTGQPKGCVLSNAYFLYVGQWYRDLGGCCRLRPGQERIITPLPVFHTNALVFSSMGMIEAGGCIIQLDRFHPKSWWQSVRESGATAVHYLGVMPAMLLNQPPGDGDDFSGQLQFGFGAGVEPAHHAAFEARFGFKLIEGWAMTETGAAACFMDAYEPRRVGRRCLGRPPAYMEYRIVDDAGRDVAGDEPGEFLVRRSGDHPRRYFFNEYYRDPAATEAAWRDGWFHTGDVVRRDAQGRLYFLERKKNIIRRSGENIAAAEVEQVLFRHAAVDNCAVAPVADAIRGEEVAACVVLAAGEARDAATARLLLSHCLEHLTYFKTPGYIIFVDRLPTTSTQKVQRGELRTLCEEGLGQGRGIDLRALKKRPADASGNAAAVARDPPGHRRTDRG